MNYEKLGKSLATKKLTMLIKKKLIKRHLILMFLKYIQVINI